MHGLTGRGGGVKKTVKVCKIGGVVVNALVVVKKIGVIARQGEGIKVILAVDADGGGIHRRFGVGGLHLGLNIAADAGQRAAGVEGVDAVAGKAVYIRAGHDVVEDLVAGIALTLNPEEEFIGLVRVCLGVGVAHLTQKCLILLRAPYGQRDLLTGGVPAARSAACAGKKGGAQRAAKQGENEQNAHPSWGTFILIRFHAKHSLYLSS